MLNTRQMLLWDNLNALATQEAFFFVDKQKDDTWYRIFNYRLVNYTAFMQEDALECRGHMFEITHQDSTILPVRLAAWPLHKFFNINENPHTTDLDLSTISRITEKHDGSIITTYIHNGSLHLKSKGSLSSVQALDSMVWLDLPENAELKSLLTKYTTDGFSVCLEWLSPLNRIVLPYDKPRLTILHIRNRDTGVYWNPPYSTIHRFISKDIDVSDPAAFILTVPHMMESIEGFVCTLNDGTWFKVKTDKYLSLHRVKDSINSPRRLFEACVDETIDDMKSMFVDDPQAIQTIIEMEEFVDYHYNHMVNNVEVFFASNEQSDRKEFAIAAKESLDKKEFGLAMALYLGRTADFKGIMKKNWKTYGLADEATTE